MAKKPVNKSIWKKNSKLSSRSGMTMAEMLITVAIILVLAAVAFISIIAYQRAMAQRERDSIAREIFIAAQNHIAMARGEGYMDIASALETASESEKPAMRETLFGYSYTDTNGEKGNYILVNGGSADSGKGSQMLELMLPFGSIDESVRVGGSYVIRYQQETGQIKDVFYCSASGTPAKFNHTISKEECNGNEGGIFSYTGDDNKGNRRNFSGGAVLGWYGGDDLDVLATRLKAPQIRIENGDKLIVTVVDTNPASIPTRNNNNKTISPELKVMITGSDSKDKVALDVGTPETNADGSRVYTVVIDDITEPGKHFINFAADSKNSKSTSTKDKRMIAGEDIRVEGVSYSSQALANIAYSEPARTNSLFDSIAVKKTVTGSGDSAVTTVTTTAYISSIRHLENLDKKISKAGYTNKGTDGKKKTFNKAKQNKDLDWNSFVTNTGFSKIYRESEIIGGDNIGIACYYPVSLDASEALEYDGLKHRVSNITVTDSYSGSAGMFGSISGGKLENLELIDFRITGTTATQTGTSAGGETTTVVTDNGNAGALAGTLSGTAVDNIVAHNSQNESNDMKGYTINGAGSAGGLIGSINAGTVTYSGAALKVSGADNAGGVIGNASGGNVTACFAGGHTKDGKYETGNNKFNVLSSGGVAGGLIGTSTANISSSYSTCSVDGSSDGNSGGLIGKATSGNISNCYATGLIQVGSGEADDKTFNNVFIGQGNATVSGSNWYYEIINEYDDTAGKQYKGSGYDAVKPLDEPDKSKNSFFGSEWKDAKATYDSYLRDYFAGEYNLKTVTQLTGETSSRYFARNHYGDWPAPETVFVNQ